MANGVNPEQYTRKEYCLSCLVVFLIISACVSLTAITMNWMAQKVGWVITIVVFLAGPSSVRFIWRKLLAWERRLVDRLETNEALQPLLEQLKELNEIFDMPRRISIVEQALRLVSRETNETLWAKLQVELGNSFSNNPLGNHAQNVELALDAYQNALKIITKKSSPIEWAMIMVNVGNVYHERAVGNYDENQLTALQAYEAALEVISRSSDSAKWALLRMNMGNLYLTLKKGKHGENIELAIQALSDSLSIRETQGTIEESADVLMNLGNAYIQRVYGSPNENVEVAISYYQRALKLRKPYSHSWAETVGNLGMAYRAQGTMKSTEEAIQYFELALKIITPETDPLRWATIQSNLAVALFNRIGGDQTENVEKALDILQSVIQTPYLSEIPEHWVDLNVNLATAYRQRSRGNRGHNIEIAIKFYLQSLKICDQYELSMKRIGVLMNLGAAFLDRLIGDPIQNIELAKRAFEDVLQELNPEDFPVQWALTMNNLANTYANQQHGNRSENISTAIGLYEKSLSIRSRERSPYEWAQTMFNYALTLELFTQENALFGQKAIASLLLTLEVFQKSLFPRDFQLVQGKLGDLHFNFGLWEEAVKYFKEALLVRNELVLVGSTTDSRTIELGKLSNIAGSYAYSLAKLGKFDEAVVSIEQNLVWLLRNSLTMADALSQKLTSYDYKRLSNCLTRIRELETQVHKEFAVDARGFSEISEELRRSHSELSEIINSVQDYLPGFMAQNIEYSFIKNQAFTVKCPIIYLLTTKRGTLALIMYPKEPSVLPLWIDEFNEKELDNILEDREERIGYIHGAVGARIDALTSILDWFWPYLADTLMQPIMRELLRHEYNQAILIPLGFLRLLPLHALNLDDFVFTMAPSVTTFSSILKWIEAKATKPPAMQQFEIWKASAYTLRYETKFNR